MMKKANLKSLVGFDRSRGKQEFWLSATPLALAGST